MHIFFKYDHIRNFHQTQHEQTFGGVRCDTIDRHFSIWIKVKLPREHRMSNLLINMWRNTQPELPES